MKAQKFNPSELIYSGVKSVSKSTAPTGHLCGGRSNLDPMSHSIHAYIMRNHSSVNILPAFVSLMFYSGIRITEALRIGPGHVLNFDKILIKGLKGSEDRIIDIHTNIKYWQLYKKSACSNDSIYTRFFFYREFKKLGFYEYIAGNDKASVTHLMRHKFVESLRSDNVSLEQVQKEIGHIDSKSTRYYDRRKT